MQTKTRNLVNVIKYYALVISFPEEEGGGGNPGLKWGIRGFIFFELVSRQN